MIKDAIDGTLTTPEEQGTFEAEKNAESSDDDVFDRLRLFVTKPDGQENDNLLEKLPSSTKPKKVRNKKDNTHSTNSNAVFDALSIEEETEKVISNILAAEHKAKNKKRKIIRDLESEDEDVFDRTLQEETITTNDNRNSYHNNLNEDSNHNKSGRHRIFDESEDSNDTLDNNLNPCRLQGPHNSFTDVSNKKRHIIDDSESEEEVSSKEKTNMTTVTNKNNSDKMKNSNGKSSTLTDDSNSYDITNNSQQLVSLATTEENIKRNRENDSDSDDAKKKKKKKIIINDDED